MDAGSNLVAAGYAWRAEARADPRLAGERVDDRRPVEPVLVELEGLGLLAWVRGQANLERQGPIGGLEQDQRQLATLADADRLELEGLDLSGDPLDPRPGVGAEQAREAEEQGSHPKILV